MEPRDGVARGGPDRIGDAEDPGELAVDGREDDRAAARRELRGRALERGGRDAGGAEKLPVADEDPVSSTSPRAPRPVTDSNPCTASGQRRAPAAFATMAAARGCSLARSTAATSASRRRSSNGAPGARTTIGHRRPALGDRARLVEHDGVDRVRPAPAPRRP